MENNGFIVMLWLLWIVAVVVQLAVSVKLFSMSSDIRAMKEMMQQFMRKQNGTDTLEENMQMPNKPMKFRWQIWMYIVIVLLGLYLILLEIV